MNVIAWKSIPGYEGVYDVSSDGQVRSTYRPVCNKGVPTRRMTGGKLMRLTTMPAGYIYVNFSVDGVRCMHAVHRLVAIAFIGPIPDGMTVNHKDGVKSNNAVENLEIISHAANIEHAADLGLRKVKHQDNPNARLTARQVNRIKRLVALDVLSHREIGAMFGVKGPAIWKIANGRAWQ